MKFPLRSAKHRVRDVGAQVLWRAGRTRPSVNAGQGPVLTVVTFHRFLPPAFRRSYPWPGLAVTPPTLRRMLAHFGTWYRVLPLSEALDALASGERGPPLLSITVDDAQADNWRFARPLLRQAGLRATFYVPTGAVERRELLWHDRFGFGLARARSSDVTSVQRLRTLLASSSGGDVPLTDAHACIERVKALPSDRRQEVVDLVGEWLREAPPPTWADPMSWSELRDLADDGHEIGGHSVSHALLPQVDDGALVGELEGCKATLEEKLGRRIRSFAYPNGSHDDRVVSATRRAGYDNAVTTRAGLHRADDDLFRIRRIDLQEELNFGSLGRLDPAVLAWRLSPLGPRDP